MPDREPKKITLTLEDTQARAVIRALSVDARSIHDAGNGDTPKARAIDTLRTAIEAKVEEANPNTDA